MAKINKNSDKKNAPAKIKVKREHYTALKFVEDVRAQLAKLQSMVADKETAQTEFEHAFQDFQVMINDFESSYRQARAVTKHQMSNNGKKVLMCNVLQDQFEKLTIAQMCEKYGIRCRNTYYKHLKKMQESDWYQNLDLNRLQSDEEYRKHVFKNDLNKHRDLLPDELKDLSDYEIVCKEF